MKSLSNVFVTLFFLFPLLMACNSNRHSIKGNYQIVEENFSVGDFSELEVNIPANVEFHHFSDTVPYLQINTDDNILPHIVVQKYGNRLVIEAKDNAQIKPTELQIKINVREINSIKLLGAGNILLKGEVNSKQLSLEMIGSGNISADSLICEQLNAKIVGSGNIRLCGGANQSKLEIVGSGNMDISGFQAGALQTSIVGSGNVIGNNKE